MPELRDPTRRDLLAALGGAALVGACASTPPGVRTLFPRIGLTAGERRAALAREVGFDHLVTGVPAHLIPDQDDAAFAARLARLRDTALPIRACNSFLPGRLHVVGPNADHAAIVRYCEALFARARRAGVDRIVFGSAAARALPQGFAVEQARDQMVALLRRLAPLAQDAGLRLLPENLNRGECNFLNRVSELWPLVAAVDHPAVRMTADLYHMRREDEPAENLVPALPWLAHVEIAERERRTVPGTAGDDFRPYFRVLVRAGWSGSLNVEAAESDAAGYRRMFTVLQQQIAESAV